MEAKYFEEADLVPAPTVSFALYQGDRKALSDETLLHKLLRDLVLDLGHRIELTPRTCVDREMGITAYTSFDGGSISVTADARYGVLELEIVLPTPYTRHYPLREMLEDNLAVFGGILR